MRGRPVGKIVMAVLLLAAAAVLGFFAAQNANRYWEANHPPHGVELLPATVTEVDTEEVCGRTSKSTARCTTEVDGLDFTLPDGTSQHSHAHATYSPGDQVEAFQDSDGDWQVQGSFTKTWAARTVGFTTAGALLFLVLGGGMLLPARGESTRARRVSAP